MLNPEEVLFLWAVITIPMVALGGWWASILISGLVRNYRISKAARKEAAEMEAWRKEFELEKGNKRPINAEWRAMVSKETEILKESEDRYQPGEDEIAETYDSAKEATDSMLRTMTIRPDRDIKKGELISREEAVRWMLEGSSHE